MNAPSMSLFLLPHLGLIRAHGVEARAFLQGQLSNDIQTLDGTRARLAGYCSAKGRLLAVLTIVQVAPDEFLLVLPAALHAATLKRLRMFVLRSRLSLDDAQAWQACGQFDVDAATTPWQQTPTDGGWQLHRPGPAHALVLVPAGLAVTTDTAQEAAWQRAELEAGLPIVHPGTLDRFVPQTANLDLAGGISLTKGCYPGQEIVARVHYLGRLKQRLFLARSQTTAAPGDAVFEAGAPQAVGEVMDCLPDPAGGHRLALVLNLAAAGSRLGLGEAAAQTLSHLQPAHAGTA